MILSSMLKRPAWLGIVDILHLVLYTSLTVFRKPVYYTKCSTMVETFGVQAHILSISF